MAYHAKILADSLNPAGCRLTTFEATYPRFVHSELMTHRAFSRNAASSRAIPLATQIRRVMNDPAMPVSWGQNQPGMQAQAELPFGTRETAKVHWLRARDAAVEEAERLGELGVHKQVVNRLLEPWLWITVIISATEYENFFSLRVHPMAQPELQEIAQMMQTLYRAATPERLLADEWHLPLTGFDGDHLLPLDHRIKVAVGRCARVSYLTHHGERDVSADLELHDRLLQSRHYSPFEHVARATLGSERSGNFTGFAQYRQMVAGNG